MFIAVGPRRPDRLDLHRRIPVAGGGDRPAIGAEADENDVIAIGGMAQLAEIELALPAHGRGGGIAGMRVVRPPPGLAALAMAEQRLQRLEHVTVAQIPRLARAAIHDAV